VVAIREKLEDLLSRKSKTPEALGIHISRDALTVARVARFSDHTKVLQLFSDSLPRDPGGWPVERVREKLAAARKSIGFKIEKARVTLPSDLAPTHFFMVPIMKGEQLRNALKIQIENKWGNAAADLRYEFVTLEKRGERCRVFAPSIPMERLRLILESFAAVNCPLDVVEVEGVSVANLAAYCGLADGAPVGVLQLAPQWAEIYILRRRKTVLSRAIMKLEDDPNRPEDEGPPSDSDEADGGAHATPDVASSYLGRVAREANKTLDYFEIELLLPAVERLILLGGTAEAPGLSAFLEKELELQVDVLDTGSRIQDKTGEYEPARHGLAVAAALGEQRGPREA